MTRDDSVSDFIVDYLKRRNPDLPTDDGQIFDRDYFADRLIDSLGAIEFISELETQFDIELSFDDFADPNFKIVGGFIAIVREKVAAAP